jgi:methylisocitrate lyase
MQRRASLKTLLTQPGVIYAGGVGDAAGAMIVEQVGYSAIFISGNYVNYTRGYPDGTLTMTEMAQRVGEIADRVTIPIIADGDDGYGDVLKVARTVREFEKAGASAVHLEDMINKKHGTLMPISQMVKRLKVAMEARRSSEFLIIARTDAVAPWAVRGKDLAKSEQDAFERVAAYAEAGADIILPVFVSTDWVKRFGNKISKPLLILGPDVVGADLESLNVKIVAFSTQMMPRSYLQMKSQYAQWLRDGLTDGVSAQGLMRGTEEDQKVRRDMAAMVGVPAENELLAQYEEDGEDAK